MGCLSVRKDLISMTPTITKICKKCHAEFLGVRCITCARKYNAAYRSANKDKVRETISAWRKENAEKVRGYDQRWAEKNKEKIALKNRLYAERNREKTNKNNAAWRSRNPEKMRLIYAVYRAENQENRKSYNSMYKRSMSTEMTDAYIASLLRVPLSMLSPQLIELKRVQLMIKRQLKEMK